MTNPEDSVIGLFCMFLCVQASFSVLRGPILDEIHQQFNPWVSQVNYD